MISLLQDLARDKKKLALAGIVLAVFLFIDFSFVVGNQIRGIENLKTKILSIRKDIEALNSDIKYVKTTTRKMVALETTKKLPSEKEIPSLMQTISTIANANGIKIMQIDSTKEVSTRFSWIYLIRLTIFPRSGKHLNQAASLDAFYPPRIRYVFF